MNFKLLGLAADSEVRGVLVQHDGLVEGRDGDLTSKGLGHLQTGLAPEQEYNTKNKKDKQDYNT